MAVLQYTRDLRNQSFAPFHADGIARSEAGCTTSMLLSSCSTLGMHIARGVPLKHRIVMALECNSTATVTFQMCDLAPELDLRVLWDLPPSALVRQIQFF